jgi:hypothetical protein
MANRGSDLDHDEDPLFELAVPRPQAVRLHLDKDFAGRERSAPGITSVLVAGVYWCGFTR